MAIFIVAEMSLQSPLFTVASRQDENIIFPHTNRCKISTNNNAWVETEEILQFVQIIHLLPYNLGAINI